MKSLKGIAVFLTLLIVSLPVAFAEELSLTYDANGNLVSGDGLYREYNSLNQLSKVYNESENGTLLQTYVYHPTQERVLRKVTFEGSENETTYYISENFVRVVNSSGTFDFSYVKHEGQLVAQLSADGSKQFIHPDHLGSSTIVTDESTNVIENSTYTPFGLPLEESDSRYGYEAKEFDAVVGDTDFHARKYSPDKGIFLQPDEIIPDAMSPQKLNRYMFEVGNPFIGVDPDGHDVVIVNLPDEAGGYGHTAVYIGTDEAGYVRTELSSENGWAFGEAHYDFSEMDENGEYIRESLPENGRRIRYTTTEEEDQMMIDRAEQLASERSRYSIFNWMCDAYAIEISATVDAGYVRHVRIPNDNFLANQQDITMSRQTSRSRERSSSFSRFMQTNEGRKTYNEIYNSMFRSLRERGWSPGSDE